jgi:transcription antitermination factor NusG
MIARLARFILLASKENVTPCVRWRFSRARGILPARQNERGLPMADKAGESLSKTDMTSMDCEEKRWFVLRVEALCEARVARRVEEMGYRCFYPRSKQFGHNRNGGALRREIEKPAMPNYIFCELPATSPRFDLFQSDDRSTRPNKYDDTEPLSFAIPIHNPLTHSLGFLSLDGLPIALRPGVVDDLKRREENGDFDLIATGPRGIVLPRWVKANRGVRIAEGPFKGFPAIIIRTIQRRLVEVEVMIFGRPSKMSLPLSLIERVSAPMPGSMA